jgi:F-type H+-transporting ATPase subunit epsilon
VAELHVELVSVEREVWSGEASQVIARTTEGEIGILPGHAPLLGQLADGGVVSIYQEGGSPLLAAVHGGFLSVTDEGVTVLAEVAELADDIDTARCGPGRAPPASRSSSAPRS